MASQQSSASSVNDLVDSMSGMILTVPLVELLRSSNVLEQRKGARGGPFRIKIYRRQNRHASIYVEGFNNEVKIARIQYRLPNARVSLEYHTIDEHDYQARLSMEIRYPAFPNRMIRVLSYYQSDIRNGYVTIFDNDIYEPEVYAAAFFVDQHPLIGDNPPAIQDFLDEIMKYLVYSENILENYEDIRRIATMGVIQRYIEPIPISYYQLEYIRNFDPEHQKLSPYRIDFITMSDAKIIDLPPLSGYLVRMYGDERRAIPVRTRRRINPARLTPLALRPFYPALLVINHEDEELDVHFRFDGIKSTLNGVIQNKKTGNVYSFFEDYNLPRPENPSDYFALERVIGPLQLPLLGGEMMLGSLLSFSKYTESVPEGKVYRSTEVSYPPKQIDYFPTEEVYVPPYRQETSMKIPPLVMRIDEEESEDEDMDDSD